MTKLSDLLMFTVGLKADDAIKQARLFQREMANAAKATAPLTDQIKALEAVTQAYSLDAKQAEIIEARLTASHARRAAKVNEEVTALRKLKEAQVDTSGLGLGSYSGGSGSGSNVPPRTMADAIADRDSAELLAAQRAADDAAIRAVETNRMIHDKNSAELLAAQRAADDAAIRAVETNRMVHDKNAAELLAAQRAADDAANRAIETNRMIRDRDAAELLTAQKAADDAAIRAVETNRMIHDKNNAELLAAQRAADDAAIRAVETNRMVHDKNAAELLAAQKAADDAAIRAVETNRMVAERREYRQGLQSRGAQYMQQFENSGEATNRQLREAYGLHRQGAISADQYARATGRIRLQNHLAYQSFVQLRTAVTTLLGPLVIVYSAWRGFTSAIRLSAELDEAKAKFRAFTGSVQEAERVLSDIRKLSSASPVSFQGGQRAVTTLLQYGVEAKKVTGTLRSLAEITGGNTERMESLSLAYAQANAAGRLMGQELLQMVNAGFNPLKVISEQTGKSMADLKAEMQNGQISFAMVEQAFTDATKEGGKFHGLLDEIAETTAGKMVKASSELEKFGTAMGDLAKPLTNSVLSNFAKDLAFLTGVLEKLNGNVTGGSNLDGAVAAASGPLAMARQMYDLLSNERQLKEDMAAIDSRATEDLNDRQLLLKRNLELQAEQQERSNVKGSDENFLRQMNALKKVTNADEYKEKFVDIVDRFGQGRFARGEVGDKNIKWYKELVAEQEKLNVALKEEERIREAFADARENAKGDFIKAKYGDNAENVELLQEQATGKERRLIDTAIDRGVPYQEILRWASAEAKAQVASLDAVKAKTKAIEDAAEAAKKAKEDAADAAKKDAEEAIKADKKAADDRDKNREKTLQDLQRQAEAYRKSMNPNADFIDRMSDINVMRDQGIIGDTEAKRMRSELAQENTKNISVSAAPVIGKGSQEAYQAATGQTLDRLTRQLQQSEQQTLLQTTIAEINRKTNEKLDALVNGQPGVLGP